MEITEVRVFPVSEERLKAYVTITLDNCFVVRDLKVINGNTGLFVAMPAKRRKDGTFKDIAHPLNSETRERMEKVILAEYDRELARGTPPTSAAAEAGGVPRASSRSYSARITFSIRSRVSLFSGWAMSLKVPSFRRFAGMATNRPVFPLITLRSRTTKQLSKVMVT